MTNAPVYNQKIK